MSYTGPQLSILTERSVVRNDSATSLDIAIEILSSLDPSGVPQERRPLNLCVVLDRSGSMEGDKLSTAKQCCINIAKRLDKSDLISIVTFSDTAEVIFNPDIARDYLELKVSPIQAGGQTDLASGWRLGLLELQTHHEGPQINRLILLSDGLANTGETKLDILQRDAESAFQLGIVTSTIGIGSDFQEDLLAALASASNGNFWFVEQTTLESIIETEFQGALSIKYEQPRLRLDLPEGVTIERQLNKLRKGIRNDFRLPALWQGKRFCYAWRLNVDPSTLRGVDHFSIGAALFDQAEEITASAIEVRTGSVDEIAAAPVNVTVLEAVQQFQLSTSDERAIKLLDEDNIPGLKDLVIEMREGMRVATSQTARSAAAAAEQARMAEEMRQMEQFGELLQMLDEIAQAVRLSEKEKEPIKQLLRKVFHHRAHRHGRRGGWVHDADGVIEISSARECLMMLREFLEETPLNPKDTKRLLREIDERLARLS